MRSPRENKRAHRGAYVAAALALSVIAGACASAETIAFSDGECVAGGCQQGSTTSSTSSTTSSSTGGVCTVNMDCAVKWGTDVFAGILDTPAAGCTKTSGCHGSGQGGVTIEAGKPHEAYLALAAYTLLAQPGPAQPYIVPCDAAGSGMLCNMKQDSGTTNPYGACGSLMPLLGTNLTMDQLNTIADWIACGAPEN